jgi:alpha-amylase/alpha-mannosidase (GH57 family)
LENTDHNAFCVHGHFYQPTREDPLTGEIPIEPGASPYANWNERINAQCYRPNAALGNFEGISFNIGPTLAGWLDKHDPETMQRIIDQDQVNVRRYGVGNAMAQSYHHTILPLASSEDKWTQIIWGIEDFKMRFSHSPAGMWLPETAIDLETLDILAQNQIQFTILAPWQAKDKSLDVSRPYWVNCFDGRRIIVFFYHRDLSTRVSFDPGATANADLFVHKILLPQFSQPGESQKGDQFLLMASDGEAYGHHHAFRDKFLSYLLTDAIRGYPLKKSYPGLWLQSNLPVETIEIEDDTSWSCHHGVKRWSDVCGCTPHGEWKRPLREAIDYIAFLIDSEYLAALEPYGVGGWDLRNKYIQVINHQLTDHDFFSGEIDGGLMEGEIHHLSQLLQAQNERQRMYASCAWFFDDFDRIEPTNSVKYAAYALWLTMEATGKDLFSQAREKLKEVKSWRSGVSADIVFDQQIQRIYDAARRPVEY